MVHLLTYLSMTISITIHIPSPIRTPIVTSNHCTMQPIWRFSQVALVRRSFTPSSTRIIPKLIFADDHRNRNYDRDHDSDKDSNRKVEQRDTSRSFEQCTMQLS